MKHKPVPTLEEMYAFLDKQIKQAHERRDRNRTDYLLEQRLRVPDLRSWLIQMGARGA